MIIDCAVYEDGRRREGELPLEDALEAANGDNAFVWIGLHEPSSEEFESVRREFDLHGLAVEDAIKAHQRPKLEVYGDSLFVVLKTARYVDPEEVVEIGEVLLFVGRSFIVSVRHGSASSLHEVREKVERDPDILSCGPGAVLHAIVDRVVDGYMPTLEGIENDIQEVEAQVFSESRENPAERIYRLLREVLQFQRASTSLDEPLDRLARGHFDLIPETMEHHFRDVHDHLTRVTGTLDGERQLLTSILDANLTQASVRQNDDMRKISAWVAILAVPTMIAGIYGMNFDHMPELAWKAGYPLALGLMLIICSGLYRYFKKVGWL